MSENLLVKSFQALIAVLFLSLGIVNLLATPELFRSTFGKQSKNYAPLQPSVAILKIDQATKIDIAVRAPAYSGTFESPFRAYSIAPKVSSTHAIIERKKLFLKGILTKAVPLAILENEHGDTQVRAAGDTVFENSIIKINASSVTLRDKRGTYELVVEE